MNSDILRKNKNVKSLIIFLIVTGISFILAFSVPNAIGTTGKNYLDNNKEVYEEVYLEIDSKPIEFKTYNDGKMRNFYIVSNKDKYFIVKLSAKQYETILKEIEKQKDDFKFKIEGKTNAIFTNLEDSSMKAFNDLKEEKIITHDNYDEYLGTTYIDAGDNTKGLIKAMLFGLGGFLAVIDVIMIIGYIYGNKTYKKVILDYGEEELVKELDDKDTIALPQAGIYLTRKYIISNSMGFKVVDYKDVLWVYILKQRNHGILVGSHLMVYKKDGKGDTLATMRKPEKLEKLIPGIASKNKKILVGYTSENNKKYKELVKENKKSGE